MSSSTADLAPGRIARIRQRTYLVEQVVKPKRAADSTLVRLSCVDDDNQGQPLEVLWEKEINPEIMTGEAWEAVASKGFDEARIFSAYFNTLKWNCVTSTDPELFQSPFRAGIHLDAYQLEPLRKALQMPRVNLFIADDVGLGKTIEAGLIARELLLRKKVREIIVSCPPSMLLQWQEEMSSRFGLTFEILDREYLKRIRRERGFSVNPWSTHTRFLVSHRLLIDETYAGPLRALLGTFRSGSLFILDEAHHAAPASGRKYAIDSRITRAVQELAPRFEHRLFLSATPHNGHSNSFSALLEILDPQRFCRGVPVSPEYRDAVVVRRLKEDIRKIQGGFAERQVVQLTIDGLPEQAPELQLAKLLDQYRELREERLKDETRRKQAAAALLLIGLQQRLLSSIEAFARTLKVHRRTVERHARAMLEEQQAPPATEAGALDLLTCSVGSDDDRATLPEEQLQREEDAQFEAASSATAGSLESQSARELFAREQAVLKEMAEIAEQSRATADARVRRLVEWIRENMCPELGNRGARWNDIRVLIFTEYEDTKRYLVGQLEAAIAGSENAEQRIEVFHGPTPPAKREEIKKAFNTPPAEHPVRILIATDAAREGLNLQAHCWNLFHFDVPWNPSRMEQRNGRIDRKLQDADNVYCHYFVYSQRPEDRILKVLVRKTETIRRELGSLSQLIDRQLTRSMNQGIRRRDVDVLESEIERTDLAPSHRSTITTELESTRKQRQHLREQIDSLRTQLERSRQAIDLSDVHFRDAISCSLELMGAEPLQQQPREDLAVPCFRVPDLDERAATASDWADTMDTLRVARKREQKLWDWRRESPIRPVVFEDPGRLSDDVVHMHLEQRVVQRLLGRFSAQGFIHHDLSRACLAQTKDSVPRVILLGRLCLYGEGAARLHEELIPVAARWTDPDIRPAPLEPATEEAASTTLGMLNDSLLNSHASRLTSVVVERLQQAAVEDIRQLRPHLDQLGEQHASLAREKLADRGQAEAQAMRDILETQRNHIADTIRRFEKMNPEQLRLDFGDDDDELQQLKDNRRWWEQRLTQIRDELKTEPRRIQELYTVRAVRVEPVGLVYLWPVTG